MKENAGPPSASHPSLVQPWHCAALSLASGTIGPVTSFYLWWHPETRTVKMLGQQLGLLSAVAGIGLAVISAWATKKGGRRRLAILAFLVNFAVLCFTLDSMFSII